MGSVKPIVLAQRLTRKKLSRLLQSLKHHQWSVLVLLDTLKLQEVSVPSRLFGQKRNRKRFEPNQEILLCCPIDRTYPTKDPSSQTKEGSYNGNPNQWWISR